MQRFRSHTEYVVRVWGELYTTKEKKTKQIRDSALQTWSFLVIWVCSKCLPFLSKQKWADVGLAISIAERLLFCQTEEQEEKGRRWTSCGLLTFLTQGRADMDATHFSSKCLCILISLCFLLCTFSLAGGTESTSVQIHTITFKC